MASLELTLKIEQRECVSLNRIPNQIMFKLI